MKADVQSDGFQDDNAWFPRLCTPRRVLGVVGLSELVVIVANVLPLNDEGFDASTLVSSCAFTAWLAICMVALLCSVRRWFLPLPWHVGLLVVGGLVAIVSGLAAMVLVSFLGLSATGSGQRQGTWDFSLGVAISAAIVTVLLLRYFEIIDRWRRQVEASAHARADALQARIRPHFLFNSMNLIAGLIRSDVTAAEKAVLDLSDLFRAALNAGDRRSTLARELALARGYLDIEQLRMGHRLTVLWEVASDLPGELEVPLLTLQPLVENAVMHGVALLPEGGAIEVACHRDVHGVVLEITNPVPGQGRPHPGHGAGHALENIHFRLLHLLGPSAGLEVVSRSPFYRVRLSLPRLPLGAGAADLTARPPGA